MAVAEITSENFEPLSRAEIIHNERLVDGAPALDNHPRPLLQTRPLVEHIDQDVEFPYSK